MIAFKDQIEEDNKKVFLNLAEFGDVHVLNGIECPCILQGDTIQQTLSIGDGINKTYPSIYGADITINVRKADLGDETPVYGQLFEVDDDQYLVESVKEDMGMLTIGLVANNR